MLMRQSQKFKNSESGEFFYSFRIAIQPAINWFHFWLNVTKRSRPSIFMPTKERFCFSNSRSRQFEYQLPGRDTKLGSNAELINLSRTLNYSTCSEDITISKVPIIEPWFGNCREKPWSVIANSANEPLQVKENPWGIIPIHQLRDCPMLAYSVVTSLTPRIVRFSHLIYLVQISSSYILNPK